MHGLCRFHRHNLLKDQTGGYCLEAETGVEGQAVRHRSPLSVTGKLWTCVAGWGGWGWQENFYETLSVFRDAGL